MMMRIIFACIAVLKKERHLVSYVFKGYMHSKYMQLCINMNAFFSISLFFIIVIWRKKRRFRDLHILNIPETQSGANMCAGFASLASANTLWDWVS